MVSTHSNQATRWIALTMLAAGIPAAQASLTILTGPPVGTHVGNLVTNGSFEDGAPAPGAANFVHWATGTTLPGPFAVPMGWTSSGQPGTYAVWGSDFPSGPYTLRGSAPMPDGVVGMYFGNGASVTVDQPPNFAHPDGTVTFPAPPNFTVPMGGPVTLTQSVPTNLTPAPGYLLSFWVSGEGANGGSPGAEGIFGLKVTNVLAGDPITYMRVPSAGAHRFEFSMMPLNPSNPISIEFINWGHLDLTAWGRGPTTELVMDDIIVNATPEPTALGLLAAAGLATLRRRT